MDVLLGVHHHKALAFQAHVTRVLNMEFVLLKEQMQEPLLPIYLMQEIQVSDTLWVLDSILPITKVIRHSNTY